MEPIEDILNSLLIPTLFGSVTPFPDHFTSLFSLPPKEGGLGIPSLKEGREQYYGSLIITEAHAKSIIYQEIMFQQPAKDYQEKIHNYTAGKEARVKEKVSQLEKVLPLETLHIVEQARDKGASLWLNTIPWKEQGYDLNKEEFRDSLRLCYNLP